MCEIYIGLRDYIMYTVAPRGGPDCQQTTVRKVCDKKVNRVVMECYYRGNPVNEKQSNTRINKEIV